MKTSEKKFIIFIKYYFTKVIRIIVAIYVALSRFWELLFVENILRNEGLEVGWGVHRCWQSDFKKESAKAASFYLVIQTTSVIWISKDKDIERKVFVPAGN